MKSPAIPASERTLLDDLRQSGLAQDLAGRIDVRVKRREKRSRAVKRGTAVLVVLIVFSFWGVPFFRSTGSVATPIAHRQSLSLDDGSIADLNARTRLHTDFRYGRRAIRLDEGEAFFSVTKDAQHPFIVETSAGIIRVLGTRFNVRLKADGVTEVTLVEGKVDFQSSDATRHLAPGQQLDSGHPSVRELSPDELAAVTAWRQGQLVLDGMTLGEAAARFARYHDCIIQVSPLVSSLRLGGSCPLDNLDHFFIAIGSTQAVRIIAEPDGSHRILPR